MMNAAFALDGTAYVCFLFLYCVLAFTYIQVCKKHKKADTKKLIVFTCKSLTALFTACIFTSIIGSALLPYIKEIAEKNSELMRSLFS